MNDTPTIPHSRDAEEAVIGSVLINPDIYYDVQGLLSPADFFIHRHGWVWEAFKTLRASQTEIDMLTVSDELDRRGELANAGGPAWLTSLINQVPSSLNAESYARIVARHALARKALQGANEIATAAYNNELTAEQLAGIVSKVDMDIQLKGASSKEPAPMSAVVSREMDRMDRIAREGRPACVSSGLVDLDYVTGGFRASELIYVAARPGAGKSALLCTIAKNASGHMNVMERKHGAFFSCEMSESQLMQRFASAAARIDGEAIRDGRLTEDEWPRYTKALETIGDWTLHIDDTARATPDRIEAKCRRLKAQGMLDYVVVDYVQIMGVPDTVLRYGSRVQEVSYLSARLLALAKELDVPVIAAAQVNREVEKRAEKRLTLADLKESGSLEQDAHVVIFLQPTEDIKAASTPVPATVAKNRNGKTGERTLMFFKQYTVFENAMKGAS